MSSEHNRALLEQIQPELAEELQHSPGLANAILRVGADLLLQIPSRLHVEWARAADSSLLREYLNSGYGILAVHNHPTKMDGPTMARIIARISPTTKGHFVVAQHQFAEHTKVLPIASRLLGYRQYSVVTPHTVQLDPTQHINEGYDEFLRGTSWALTNGEYVSIPVDAERVPVPGSTGQSTTGLLLWELDKIQTPTNYIVLPVGIVPPQGYDDGYNWFSKFTVRVGTPLDRNWLNARFSDRTLRAREQRKKLYGGINETILQKIVELLG